MRGSGIKEYFLLAGSGCLRECTSLLAVLIWRPFWHIVVVVIWGYGQNPPNWKSEKNTPPSCYEIASQSVAGGTIDEAPVVGDIMARCACEVEKRDLLGSNFPTEGERCFCVGLWLGSISWGVDLQPQFSRLVMGMCQLAHEIVAKYRPIITAGCKVFFWVHVKWMPLDRSYFGLAGWNM